MYLPDLKVGSTEKIFWHETRFWGTIFAAGALMKPSLPWEPFTNTCKGGLDAENIYRENFSGPPSDRKKKSGPPFLLWKLRVNPIEKHSRVSAGNMEPLRTFI